MRWFWIDKFVEFERGRRAVSVKNVSLVEAVVDNYVYGYPALPPSLIVEGLAQTGGMLVGQYNDFRERVVLAKVTKAVFHEMAIPGDTLKYTAVIESIQQHGAMVTGTSHLGDRLQAEVDLVFAHLDDRYDVRNLFDDYDLLQMLRVLRLFEVGRTEDGGRISIPAQMAEMERKVDAANGLLK